MIKEKEARIEIELIEVYKRIGCDRPSNHNSILGFVIDDVTDSADPISWHSGDVAIAFRRWIESNNHI